MAEKFTSYSVDNDKRFEKALRKAAKELGDLRAPLKLISNDFYVGQAAIFKLKSQGQYDDLSTKPFVAKWSMDNGKKIRPGFYPGGYKEYKTVNWGFAYPILRRTGRLESSITTPSSAESINVIEKFSLTIGTKVPYAKYHQSDGSRKKIPLRKFLFIGPEAIRFANRNQKGRLNRWRKYLKQFCLKKAELIGEVK